MTHSGCPDFGQTHQSGIVRAQCAGLQDLTPLLRALAPTSARPRKNVPTADDADTHGGQILQSSKPKTGMLECKI